MLPESPEGIRKVCDAIKAKTPRLAAYLMRCADVWEHHEALARDAAKFITVMNAPKK